MRRVTWIKIDTGDPDYKGGGAKEQLSNMRRLTWIMNEKADPDYKLKG